MSGDGQGRYVCIHGHFYQPPRENAWLEAIEQQESAFPYHDWNEKIDAECYTPNTACPGLDGNGRVDRVRNNFSRISFNFGPTLLSWLERHNPETYRAIRDADRESRRHFGGHGSALAQVYSHPILPLCNARDKQTQVSWGIRDFEHRFGRRPEGMWLPETAVDLESLDVLASHGIRFTILAPKQAARVRPLGGSSWHDLGAGKIDPGQAYLLRLDGGREMRLFFYDGSLAHAVAFEGLLSAEGAFAERLLARFDDDAAGPRLVHVATDGETYGHHYRHGETALAGALDRIDALSSVALTNYGEFLERHPPTHEVEIRENTAWSCAHGLGRWNNDCGCRTGDRPGWHQAWRAPLREALDWLRDTLAPRFETAAGELLRDPWVARDGYIDIVLDQSPASIERYLARHAQRPLHVEERTRVLELLELQRHALLMFTSCGWFFDELSGIETRQVLQYAARALELGEKLFAESLEPAFLELLERARANDPRYGNGRRLFEETIPPARRARGCR